MSNRSQVFLASAAQVAGTVISETFFNPEGDAAHFAINISSIAGGTPTLTVTVEAQDIASGLWYPLLASAALNAASAGVPTVLRILPTGLATANLIANDCLPEKIRVKGVVAGAGTITYSVGGCILAA